MTNRPNTKSAKGKRKKRVIVLSDEALIKQYEAAIYSDEICKEALDLIDKRLASGELSETMLLRIIVSLSKSTAYLL